MDRRGSQLDRKGGRVWGPRRHLSLVAAAAVLSTVALASAAHAQPIDCSNPDNLCTGDPCVITGPITVQSPCIADFGTRTLRIEMRVNVPNDGVLDLTAGTIEVDGGRINGSHLLPGAGDGADVSLTASGNISMISRSRIDVSGRITKGTIVLDAGGNIALEGWLVARARGRDATATGGNVGVAADGTLTSTRRARVDARGRTAGQGAPTAGGQISLQGDDGVTLAARVDASGSGGGTVLVESVAGDVTLEPTSDVIANAQGFTSAPGGSITVDAAGGVSFISSGPMPGSNPVVVARGRINTGGSILVLCGTLQNAVLRAEGTGNPSTGGSIQVSCAGSVEVKVADVDGRGTGGDVTIDSGDDVSVNQIFANGLGSGLTSGGSIAVTSSGGDVSMGIGAGARFRANGASGGDIVGDAFGNLTAIGRFEATVGGLIDLSAGGVLDTCGATFDPPFGVGCPPSPSGAFLDVTSGPLE